MSRTCTGENLHSMIYPRLLRASASAVFFACVFMMQTVAAPGPENDKLNIICFGAHPDDCEIQVGGTAMMWAAKGHRVKFVSMTNGDIGHWREAGGPLARRRLAEVLAAGQILGVTNEVLDIHDGELEPTLENRRKITRLIREWNADLVISHRPNDYHPDHRYAAVLVQDAAYMVTVPFFCPDVPALKKNPVFMYSPDPFKKPNAFQVDMAVSIDPVIERRLDALDVMTSQFYEGGANGSSDNVPTDPGKQTERRKLVRANLQSWYRDRAERSRSKLVELYGREAGGQIRHAEIFEVCEYGRRPDQAELARLFPFYPIAKTP